MSQMQSPHNRVVGLKVSAHAATGTEHAAANEAAAEAIPLNQLPKKRCGTVSRVDLREGVGTQLVAMGICIGRQVEVVKGGDPLIVRVLGSRIGLCKRLAERVWVYPCTAQACETKV